MADEVPIHRKFGYDHMVETAEMREALIAKGVSGTALIFEVSKEYLRRHRDDPSFRMMQQQRSFAEQAEIKRVTSFSADELAAIRDRFSQSNDDLGKRVYEKALNALSLAPTPGDDG